MYRLSSRSPDTPVIDTPVIEARRRFALPQWETLLRSSLVPRYRRPIDTGSMARYLSLVSPPGLELLRELLKRKLPTLSSDRPHVLWNLLYLVIYIQLPRWLPTLDFARFNFIMLELTTLRVFISVIDSYKIKVSCCCCCLLLHQDQLCYLFTGPSVLLPT